MLKQFLAAMALFFAASAFAAVEANNATAAELDSIKGIGPAISRRILDERKKSNFKDWSDFIARVKGVGEGNAAKYAAGGLTVAGEAFKAAAAKPASSRAAAKASRASATKPAASGASATKSAASGSAAKAAGEKAAASAAKK